jgi:hypothetical protein
LNKDFVRHLPVADSRWTKPIPCHGRPPVILEISPAIFYDFASNQAVSSRDRRGNAGVGEQAF